MPILRPPWQTRPGQGPKEVTAVVLSDVAAVLVRRWYVAVIGVVCTSVLGALVFTHGGVYWSRNEIVFLAPSSRLYPNSLKTTSEDLIITAGIVAKRINGTHVLPKVASPDVTLVGRGVTDGYWVALPDTGGQWAPNFAEQLLDVQVVGPTEEVVRERQAELVQRIDDELEALQVDAGVEPVNRITTKLVPVTPSVRYVAGDRRRALLMTAVLGAGATLGVMVLLESRRRARRHRPRGQVGRGVPVDVGAPATG
jgi:hypothetical protein